MLIGQYLAASYPLSKLQKAMSHALAVYSSAVDFTSYAAEVNRGERANAQVC
jgi:hypothetical protein